MGPNKFLARERRGLGARAVIGLAKDRVPSASVRTVQLTVQFQMQKGCETHFQASHPWRKNARVYVSSVNIAYLKTDTPFRCATGLRHVPRTCNVVGTTNLRPFDA